MPLYTMKNIASGEVEDMYMNYSAKLELETKGEWKQIHTSAPSLVRTTTSSISKTPDSYKDLLKTIKKKSGSSNTIKT